MDSYDYVIIGGGIAGVTAAETIRQHDPEGLIVIISREPHLPYSRVLLPSYLKKRISRERLFLRSRQDFADKPIDLLLGEEVIAVHPDDNEVIVSTGARVGYKKLLIAAGGRAAPWGTTEDQKYVYRLQTIDDADRLLAAMAHIREPIVIGSSFIALEFLEIFLLNQITPRLIARGPYFFSSMLDEAGGALIRSHVAGRGIECFFDDAIIKTSDDGTMLVVSHQGGTHQCDAIAVGAGIERNRGFFADSGITLGQKGILADEFLETSRVDIFVAGDSAEFFDIMTGAHRILGNWTNAVEQGACVGRTMAGKRTPFSAIASYSITVLGMQITALGQCEGGLEGITRMDTQQNHYERLFLRSGVIVGAFLINRLPDRSYLHELIARRKNLEQYRAFLSDPAFDIHTIPLIS